MRFVVCPEDATHLSVVDFRRGGLGPLLTCEACGRRYVLGVQGAETDEDTRHDNPYDVNPRDRDSRDRDSRDNDSQDNDSRDKA